MEARVVAAVAAAGEAGEDVLPGVLLHHVQAPLPVDLPADGFPHGEGALRQVDNHAVPLLDVRYPDAGQDAVVRSLAAPLGIEGRAVQDNLPPVSPGRTGKNRGRKDTEPRIPVKKPFRLHRLLHLR